MKPWKNDKAERLTLFLTQIKKKKQQQNRICATLRWLWTPSISYLQRFFPDLGQAKNGDQQPQELSNPVAVAT